MTLRDEEIGQMLATRAARARDNDAQAAVDRAVRASVDTGHRPQLATALSGMVLGAALTVVAAVLLPPGRPSIADRPSAPVTPIASAGTPSPSLPSASPSASAPAFLAVRLGHLSFRHPAEWPAYQANQHAPINDGPIVYLTNATPLGRCATPFGRAPNPPDERGRACGRPFRSLPPNGVLVTWLNTRIPQPLGATGEPVTVNGMPTRLTRQRPGACGEIGGEITLFALVPLRTMSGSSNLAVEACLRGPNIASSEAQFRQLLESTAVDSPGSISDPVEALKNDLEAAGATVAQRGTFGGMPLSGRGVRLCVNGQVVRVFVYETAEGRAADAKLIDRADPSHVGRAIVEWLGPPRFWQRDRVILLYLGADPVTERRLRSVLGEPFAEGRVGPPRIPDSC